MRCVCRKTVVVCALAAAAIASWLAPAAGLPVVTAAGEVVRVRDHRATALTAGDRACGGDLLIAGAGRALVVLGNGERLAVYPHSRVLLPRQNGARAWIADRVHLIRARIERWGDARNDMQTPLPVIAVRE